MLAYDPHRPRNLPAGLVLVVLRVQVGWRPPAHVPVVDLDRLLARSLVAGGVNHEGGSVCQLHHPARLC